MRNITDLMQHYRIAARSVWNTAFWSVPELRTWDSRDRFEKIKQMLFNTLVVARVEENGCCEDLANRPPCIYRVVPNEPGPVHILIHQPREFEATPGG